MAYKEHSDFLSPDKQNAKIWRYMDLAKFLSLLDSKSLYFARLDTLSLFDPFEGYYTKLNVAVDNLPFEEMTEEWKERTGIKDEEVYNGLMQAQKQSRELVKYHREVTFVNSWHIKEHESAAMWKVYLSNNEGICIQTTYEKLIKSLANYDDYDIHVGKIKYIDYEKEAIPMGNLLSPFLFKRKSFEYEEELRALIWTPQHGKNSIMPSVGGNKYKDTNGIYIPIDVGILIENIYVAPSAPKWIADLINSLTEKYGLNANVVQSDLSEEPIY